jgi:hypothetical protein
MPSHRPRVQLKMRDTLSTTTDERVTRANLTTFDVFQDLFHFVWRKAYVEYPRSRPEGRVQRASAFRHQEE